MPDAYFDTATTNFDKTVVEMVRARIMEELRSNVVHMVDADKAQYVKGINGKMRFVAYRDPSVTTGTPSPGTAPWLTEGVAPDIEELSIGYDEMTAYQAGRVWGITDVSAEESPHDLIATLADRVAFNAARTLDKYIADIIGAGTSNTIFSGSSNSQTSDVAAGDIITGLNVKQAVKQLASDAVPRFPDGYYHAIIHPAAVYGLQVDDDAGGWIDANKYTDSTPLLKGELGRYAGVRFMESAYAHVKEDQGTSSIDVYSTVVYGPNAFAFGDLQTLRTYITRGATKDDPLNQIAAKIGWKAMFGAVLLDNNGAKYVRIESAGI